MPLLPFGPAIRAQRVPVTRPVRQQWRRRRGGMMGLGIAPISSQFLFNDPRIFRGGPGGNCPFPRSELIIAGATWDPINCRWILPVQPPPGTPIATPGSPVPAGFPTNQLFMAPDGSQWAFSVAQGRWLNVGTPYDLSVASNPPPASTSTPPPAAAAPVSVTVAPPAAGPSPYQSILDFATQSSLISGVPNWIVALGAGLLWKAVSSSMGSKR
jgi:hypothetical protein